MNDNNINSNLSHTEAKVLENHFKHFDIKPSPKKAVKFIQKVASDTNEVTHHRFLPFITFNMEKRIYRGRHHSSDQPQLKIKQRPIALSAYKDALIYAHYAEQLDKYYESYIAKDKINRVPTAYRKQLHSSNIHAAKEVFDHVTEPDSSLIIKGDFKGFFDNIRHHVLTENLCKVLCYQKLSSDWQAIIKSLTRYRWVSKEDLLNALKQSNMQKYNGPAYIQHLSDLGKLVKSGNLKLQGPNQIGIPQGTAISAILANVYMVDFDKAVNDIVSNLNGIYRRYSDDFIITVPIDEQNDFDHHKLVDNIIKLSQDMVHLQIEKHKTKLFKYKDNQVTELSSEKPTNLDYLGFVFDGQVVQLRNKAIYKFHYKSKRSINRLIRLQKDYFNVKNQNVPGTNQLVRKSWKDGQLNYRQVYQIPKKIQFKARINGVKNKLNLNMTQHKITTKMYLSAGRYGENHSMFGYAKKAQKILSKSNDPDGNRYDVNIIEPIKKQIHKNQKYYAKLKKDETKRRNVFKTNETSRNQAK